MGHKFADIAFTASVKAVQKEMGSRKNYEPMAGPEDYNAMLTEREMNFIAKRDSFYMASVSETGWPYIQHRGGPQGFVKILDEHTIGFADYAGNRQYVSVGNFRADNRVSLFFMDYRNRRRLKVLGRVRLAPLEERDFLDLLEDGNFRAQVERGIIIKVEAFDWNCPQFITPRFSEAEVDDTVKSLREDNLRLREQLTTSPDPSAHSAPATGPGVLGAGPLHLRITAVKQLTSRVRAYCLRNVGGKMLPPFQAGAHLRIPVKLNDNTLSYREYSIASDPARLDHYEIAVNLESDSRGGSSFVHSAFQLGTEIRTGLAINHFQLHESSRRTILIAGGIGITPLKSMSHALATRRADFQLLYAGKSSLEMPYYDELQHEIPDQVRFFCSSENNRLNVSSLLDELVGPTEIYVCGPQRLIEEVLQQAADKGVSKQLIHFEMFD